MKSNLAKTAIIAAIVMVISLAVAATVFFATGGFSVTRITSSNIEEAKDYQIEGIKSINVRTISSEINVYRSEGEKIEIYFSGDISTNLKENAPRLITEISGSDLDIYIEHPRAITIGIVNFMDLRLDVLVPKDYLGDLVLTSTSGALDVRGIVLEDTSLNSVSGRVIVDDLTASSIDIESTSGRISLKDISGRLSISSTSGEVSCELKELRDHIEINTISGAVRLYIPETSSFDLDLESVSGKIQNEFELKTIYVDDNNLEATAGGGEFNIDIKTTSGSININKR